MLNLGKVKANSLYIEGQNVTVLDTNDVTNAGGTPLTGSTVTIRSENTPSIGYQVGTTRNVAFNENGVSVNHAVHEYDVTDAASHTASATARHWVVKKISTSGDHAWPYDCMLVNDVYDLQHIGFNDTTADKRYLLKNDIDAGVTQTNLWNDGKGFKPIEGSSGKFLGGFDGAGHTIKNLYIHRPTENQVGLFSMLGKLSAYIEAHIANVTLTGGSVTGKVNVGSVVGYVEGGYLRNLRNFNTVTGESHVGGITGVLSKSYGNMARIDNAYNAGEIGTFGVTDEVGGIVGRVSNTIVQSAANVGEVRGKNDVGGVAGSFSGVAERLENIYNTGLVEGQDAVGGILGHLRRNGEILNGYHANDVHATSARGGLVGKAELSTGTSALLKNVIWNGSSGLHDAVGSQVGDGVVLAGADVHEVALGALKAALIYADWKDGAGKALVSTQGGKGTPWRLYAEETMPLLTGLMQGTKTVGKVYDGTSGTGNPHVFLSAPGKNVGGYEVYGDQLGYDIVGRYIISPKKLKVNFSFSKTYDGTTDAAVLEKDVNYTLIGVVGSDDVYFQGTGAYEDKNAGTGKAMTFTDLLLTGYEAENYTLGTGVTRLNATGTITKKPLTMEKVTADTLFTKVYDGTTAVTQPLQRGVNYTLFGFIADDDTDDVTLAAGASGTYATKDVQVSGVRHNVTFTGLTLTGTGAGNYTIAPTQMLVSAGIITPKELTFAFTSSTRFDKVYDGVDRVTQTLVRDVDYTLDGFIGGEGAGITLDTGEGKYADKNVGVDKVVTFSGRTLSGVGAKNYSVAAISSAVGTITPKTVTPVAICLFDKEYDGNRSVRQPLKNGTTYTFTNSCLGDELGLTGTGTYADKNVGMGRIVTFTNLSLTGKDAKNYTLSETSFTSSGDILAKTLTINETAGTHFTKVYDGNTTINEALQRDVNYTLSGVVDGEEGIVALNEAAAHGDYQTKDAQAEGTKQNVNFTGLTLTGTGASNYTIAGNKTFMNAGVITPKALTFALISGVHLDKVYDGNDNVTHTLVRDTDYTLNGFVGSEGTGITLDVGAGKYADKNVGVDKVVTFSGRTLTGAGAENYTITPVTTVGTITPRPLMPGLVGSFDKTYDGNANVTQALALGTNYLLMGSIAGDALTLTGTGTYADKNAGVGKAVTFTGLTLTGADAGNYALGTATLTGGGTIAPKALTMEKVAGAHFTKVYDGNKNVTETLQKGVNYTLTGAAPGEDDTVVSIDTTSAHGAYRTKDAQAEGTMQDVDFTGITLTGTGAGNYTLGSTMTIAGAGKITPKELNVDLASGVHFDKTYDGDANVTQTLAKGANYTLTNFVTGEGAGITLDETVRGRYADKNAGADKAVTFDGLTLTGTGAGNYRLNKTALTGTGTIDRRMLGVTFTTAPVTKVYDGTTNAITALSKGDHYTLTNFAAGEGDGITITGTGTFADKNVGTKAANFSALTLTGEGAGNYQLATTTHTGTGEITPRDLTLTADEKIVTQGEALPAFTGRAEGFAAGEDASVFGTDRLAFTSDATDTNTLGSYAVTGRIGSIAEGLLGNYRIRQAAGNARAFTVTAMPVSGGIFASLVQDAKPVFDDGYSRIVYLFGTPRPVRALTLGLYRFDAGNGLEIQGLHL